MDNLKYVVRIIRNGKVFDLPADPQHSKERVEELIKNLKEGYDDSVQIELIEL